MPFVVSWVDFCVVFLVDLLASAYLTTTAYCLLFKRIVYQVNKRDERNLIWLSRSQTPNPSPRPFARPCRNPSLNPPPQARPKPVPGRPTARWATSKNTGYMCDIVHTSCAERPTIRTRELGLVLQRSEFLGLCLSTTLTVHNTGTLLSIFLRFRFSFNVNCVAQLISILDF